MPSNPTRAERRAATAARILEAAQAEFGERGHDGATVRGIARRAGVDPSLVLQHYGSKQALFSLAVRPAEGLVGDDVPAHVAEVLRARLLDLPPATRALMRSMLTSPEAATTMREFLEERVANLQGALGGEDAEARAALIVSAILGVTVARHFLDLAPLGELDDDRLSGLVDSWLAPLVAATPQGPTT